MVTDTEMHKELNMTKAQFDRQMKKIQEVIFAEIIEEQEDGYLAEVKAEILELIMVHLPLNEGMNEETFTEALQTVILELINYINENTTGLNQKLVRLFVSDFLSQSLESIFRVEERDEENGDMMYG